MPRTTSGTTRSARHKKILEKTKGFRGANNRLYKRAKEASLHAGMYAYIGRKLLKRDIRSLWVTRISAAVKEVDAEYNYSRFMKDLKTAKIELNRKMLSELAISDFSTFTQLVSKVRS